jgi:hypothetical protein
MIPWREKWRAASIHFAGTLLAVLVAAAVVFGVWYPGRFSEFVGGRRLFEITVVCTLVLGPLLSLVVYNSRKSRGKLVFDYLVIGALQLGALVYGMGRVTGSRPVYIVYVGDRFEVTAAADIRPAELAAARDPVYRSISWTGPRLVAMVVPLADHNDALFESLSGNEEHQRPKFFVPFDSQLANLRKRAAPLDELVKRHPEVEPLLAEARDEAGLPDARLRWLPVRFRQTFWTVLIDSESGRPRTYIPLDPY